MATWKIRLLNTTGMNVDVMVFQVVPNSFIHRSCFTAWSVANQPSPGNTGLELPETFEFCVIDYFGDQERQTGPYEVKYGYEVKISQPNAEYAPTVTCKFNENIPQDRIKVCNLKGNAQPLEMALFKNGRKMVFYKDVQPNGYEFMAIKRSVYMAVVSGVKPGQEFPTISHLYNVLEAVGSYSDSLKMVSNSEPAKVGSYSEPSEFQLLEDKLVMDIIITMDKSGEYVFTQKYD